MHVLALYCGLYFTYSGVTSYVLKRVPRGHFLLSTDINFLKSSTHHRMTCIALTQETNSYLPKPIKATMGHTCNKTQVVGTTWYLHDNDMHYIYLSIYV